MVCSWMHGNIQNNILRLKQCLMYKSFYRGNRRPSDMEYMDSPFLPMSICKAHWLVISMPWFLAGCMIIFRIIVSIHDLAVSNSNLGFRRTFVSCRVGGLSPPRCHLPHAFGDLGYSGLSSLRTLSSDKMVFVSCR